MTDPATPEGTNADHPGGEPPGAAAPVHAPPPAPPPIPAPAGDRRAPARTRGSLPDLGSIAVAAGLIGLFAGPILIARSEARLIILVADIVALTLGAWTVWGSSRGFARLDMGIAAILTGGISLFMYVAYVTGPPPPGGT